MKIVDLLKKESIDLNGTVSDKKETSGKLRWEFMNYPLHRE